MEQNEDVCNPLSNLFTSQRIKCLKNGMIFINCQFKKNRYPKIIWNFKTNELYFFLTNDSFQKKRIQMSISSCFQENDFKESCNVK
uniref:Uncharacterized protein n=1 Tax=viral metagenome TaxID=1070528 RepID=A0A6C0CRD9_9ZZZZ